MEGGTPLAIAILKSKGPEEDTPEAHEDVFDDAAREVYERIKEDDFEGFKDAFRGLLDAHAAGREYEEEDDF